MRKNALITGASSGIGYEFAYLFAKDAYNLVLVARSQDKLTALKQDLENQFDINVTVITKDLSKPNSAQEVFDEVQSIGINIDVLVNNAGLGDFGEFAKSDISKINAIIELNINTL